MQMICFENFYFPRLRTACCYKDIVILRERTDEQWLFYICLTQILIGARLFAIIKWDLGLINSAQLPPVSSPVCGEESVL